MSDWNEKAQQAFNAGDAVLSEEVFVGIKLVKAWWWLPKAGSSLCS